jgi:hypothetical protein
MRKARLLFLFALLMTAVTGVWADDWTDIIINGNMEGSDRQCFFVKENGLGSENLYYARIQDGIGKEGSRAILVQSTGVETYAWDTQFFLRLPYELPAGTKYRLTFDYMANVACECDLQSQNEPAEYIIYYIDNAQGSPACSFKTAWDTYDSGELTVPADCDGSQTTQEGLDFKNNFQTISFNMAKNGQATQFIIDNIKFEILSSVASGLTKSPAPRVLPQYPVEINSMAIMGDFLGKGTEGNWNMENAWALTKDENIWKLTKEFTAEAKTYEYKVFANDNMDDFTYPVEAKGQFVISEAGNYILNIFADPEGNTVSVKAVAPVNYTVKLKDGVTDADKWTIAPAEAATDGVYEGTKVTLTYSGRLKVKSVKTEIIVDVESIMLNKDMTSITVGQTATLSVASLLPDNASDKTVTWSSSDETIATVDQNGVVTAVAQGNANIYATANDGTGVKGTCSVNCVVESSAINMAEQTADVTIPEYTKIEVNGANASRKITIGNGSEVTFDAIDVNAVTLQGDANIIIANSNKIREGKLNLATDGNVVINGTGVLNVYTNDKNQGSPINGSANLTIESGTVNVNAAAVEKGQTYPAVSVKNFILKGGKIVAVGGNNYYYSENRKNAIEASEDIVILDGEVDANGRSGLCAKNVTISGGTVKSIGSGDSQGGYDAGIVGSQTVTISGGTVTAQGAMESPGIGAKGTCGDIIITGGTVIATGGSGAAAIGTGSRTDSKCGNITITKGVTKVIATKGSGATNSIGKGNASSTCGTVTIDGVEGAITQSPYTYPAVFTVDAGKTVKFSKGNLQATYNGSSWIWGFAEHQWDYIGNAAGNTSINGNGTVSANGTVDLFGWVGASSTWTGAAQYGISNSTATNNVDGYGNVGGEAQKVGWGATVGTEWRTLTRPEWLYLLSTRETGITVNSTDNARYTQATINTDGTAVKGLIIFPDSYAGGSPAGVTWGTINAKSTFETTCTSAGWIALEAAGCVFLPAAGYREESTVTDAGDGAGYWSSSSSYATSAFALYFESDYMSIQFGGSRKYGFSVRLVRDAD